MGTVLKRVKKYYYNTESHRFEKLKVPWRTKLLWALGFICAALVIALIIVAMAFEFLDSPKEKKLNQELYRLNEHYAQVNNQLSKMHKQLAEIEERDNQVYRSIFESAPISDSVRYGHPVSKTNSQYRYAKNEEIINEIDKKIGRLQQRIYIQDKSFDTLEMMVKNKEEMLSSIPAIIPVSFKSLNRIASGFGYRIDPIYKTPKLHTGLDFSAPSGSLVYATANGKIELAEFDDGGYGNHVIINHGYGYKTLYGHMIKLKVKVAQSVKRGEVIGWVGSTGKSTGPHLHYEVIRYGNKVNPVHFFFNDLSAETYELLVKKAANTYQSFD